MQVVDTCRSVNTQLEKWHKELLASVNNIPEVLTAPWHPDAAVQKGSLNLQYNCGTLHPMCCFGDAAFQAKENTSFQLKHRQVSSISS